MCWFKKIKAGKNMGAVDYIIVGLGNPGTKYETTRHNSGFLMIDSVAQQLGAKFNSSKFDSLCSFAQINGVKVMLLKPQTYMNLSGQAVRQAMNFYKIPPENVIVIFDDISLPVGKMRIRKSGSHGGQNGMKNILQLCGSSNFPRIKIGVGQKPNENWDLADWVLSSFSVSERKALSDVAKNVFDAINLMIVGKIDEAMNKFN